MTATSSLPDVTGSALSRVQRLAACGQALEDLLATASDHLKSWWSAASMSCNFYDVLQVDRNAPLEEIKLAFKRRALQVHPDKGGNKEAFHLVYQALETLANPEARKRYDYCMASKAMRERGRKRRTRDHSSAKKEDPEPKTANCSKKPTAVRRTKPPASDIPQSKETKLLMKIHDLLKQLPRDVRNFVFIKQFSQQQRLILEKWMVEQPTRRGPDTQADVERVRKSEAATKVLKQDQPAQIPSSALVMVPEAAASDGQHKHQRRESTDSKKKAARAQGRVIKVGQGSRYRVDIYFDALHLYTSSTDFQTALDYLVVLTFVKQKMQDRTNKSALFEEHFQEALTSCAREHGISTSDLKLSFCVSQTCKFFIGPSLKLRTPMVRSIEKLGQMRRCLESFRQYSRCMGQRNLLWLYTPAHLQDAWEMLQKNLAEAWEIAGADCSKFIQKIRAGYEASATFRSRQLQVWERHHMSAQDKNRYRPRRLQERRNWQQERWEQKGMAMQDKNQHRQSSTVSPLSRKLLTVKMLLARWERMLNFQRKKEQEKRRRREALNRRRVGEEERLRREARRKRMKSDSDIMQDLHWI
eukprot:s811_g9.t1